MSAHALALQPIERGFLYAYGLIKFAPAPTVQRPKGRTPGRKNGADYGRVKHIALLYLEGAFPGQSISEVAEANLVGYESLKASIWKLRKEGETP